MPWKRAALLLLCALFLTVPAPVLAQAKAAGLYFAQTAYTIDLAEGSQLQLKPVVTPAGSTRQILWKSGNTAVATVSQTGLVTAKKVGTVKIGARLARTSKWKLVTVKVKDGRRPTSVRLSLSSLKLAVGASETVSAACLPATAVQTVSWRSSNSAVASVSQDGLVTGKKKGKAVIRATSTRNSAVYRNLAVTVVSGAVAPTKVTLDKTSANLTVGKTLALTATVSPAAAQTTLAWKSSNPKVASVDETGLVTALGIGKCTISVATANQKTASCLLTVGNASGVIVDISEHNRSSSMNWATIAKNVDLLILRCGVTRTYTDPIGVGIDNSFAYYAKQCKSYGIPFGVYYYGKCADLETAEAEARKTWEVASPYSPLFYVYDAEEDCLNKALIERYMTTLQSLGAKKTGYYIAHHRYKSYNLDTNLVDFIWLPHYGKNDGTVNSTPSYPCDLHQYTSLGRVSGFPGKVDVNRLMGTKPLSWFLAR